MKETEFLNIIKSRLTDSHFIGDDCADLKEFGLFLTQDSLVEDVHFKLKFTDPYKLGMKAIAVNVSDLASHLSTPEYVSIGLSLPKNTSIDFVSELYRGINDECNKYGLTVTGGDITSSDKVFVSVAMLGKRRLGTDVSRKFAKPGDFLITTGAYGASAAGLFALQHDIYAPEVLLKAHLTPEARINEAYKAAGFISENVAVTDTSDGLADSLYKIALASGVDIEVDFKDIPVLPETLDFIRKNNLSLSDTVLWGGEDYELVFSVPYFVFSSLGDMRFSYLGQVLSPSDNPTVKIKCGCEDITIDEKTYNDKSYNHFEYSDENS